ncbi:16841_t:CDS:2, partial [Gigaspora rosea]
SGVNYRVIEMVRRDDCSYHFSENEPDQSWWKRFLKDYSELSFCGPQALNEAHTQKVGSKSPRPDFNNKE